MVQQMAIYDQGCKLMVRVSPYVSEQMDNLSQQDAGQNVPRFGRQVSDMNL